MLQRRDLLQCGLAAAAGLAAWRICPGEDRNVAAASPISDRLCLFTDHLDDFGYSYAEVGRMLVFPKEAKIVLQAEPATRIVLLGGAPLDGERYIDWNFVSSSKERLEQAKRDWREGRFPKVPGDDVEFIPLPE